MGILILTDGASPSNVSLAAGSGTPNQACTLVDVARSTSACDIELSSSTLLFLADGFEGLAATKNTPLLRITSSSFPLFLAIQHRSFAKYTSNPETNMDLSDQIDRLMSNTRCTAVTLPVSLSHSSPVSFRAVAFLLLAMVSFYSIYERRSLGRF